MSRFSKYKDIQYDLTALLTSFFPILKDRWYIACLYRLKMGYWMNFKDPKTYTEKIQWLKLYDRRKVYTQMVDKFEVKKYVAKIIGEQYVTKTYAVYDSTQQINWEELPQQFVLKTTNGGGGNNVYICKDKTTADRNNVSQMMEQSMKYDIYRYFGEWPYKNVKPRIIAEQLLEAKDGDIRDYKFYCFNGEPKLLLVASNRFTSHNFDYFDLDFQHLEITSCCGEHAPNAIEKPANFELMKDLVRKLAKDMPHVRVDMYNCDGHIYFGEMTFYDSSGFDNLQSKEWNRRLGDWLQLPSKNQ